MTVSGCLLVIIMALKDELKMKLFMPLTVEKQTREVSQPIWTIKQHAVAAPPRMAANYRFLAWAKLHNNVDEFVLGHGCVSYLWQCVALPTYSKWGTTAPRLSEKSRAEVCCLGKRSTVSSFFTSPPLRPQSSFFAIFSQALPAPRILQDTGPHVTVVTVP